MEYTRKEKKRKLLTNNYCFTISQSKMVMSNCPQIQRVSAEATALSFKTGISDTIIYHLVTSRTNYSNIYVCQPFIVWTLQLLQNSVTATVSWSQQQRVHYFAIKGLPLVACQFPGTSGISPKFQKSLCCQLSQQLLGQWENNYSGYCSFH